jgi:hypothetical protein
VVSVRMIGVVTSVDQRSVTREFFELFKTPWDFWQSATRYDVILDATGATQHPSAKLVIAYADGRPDAGTDRPTTVLSYQGDRIPVYGRCLTFPSNGYVSDVVVEGTNRSVVSVSHERGTTIVRLGYDLLGEVRYLLTIGQPASYAAVPTIERHIAILRDTIVRAGIPLVEIPPVPAGHRFMACLTHDVDHASIRPHKLDRTMFGFLYRSVLGSLVNWSRKRITADVLRENLAAALRLPLVHLGWARDFWSDFDRYLEIEQGLGSTFFVIPERNNPGQTAHGAAPRKRGASYRLPDIARQLEAVLAAGGEVAVHGIDAWRDSTRGNEERQAVARVIGTPPTGSRMHWLYWEGDTPRHLERAGFTYDSTIGYNDTVGFRAGTTQAFRPLPATRLLELPLHVMDTALFYPAYLNLTQHAAHDVVRPLIDATERFGGTLTINWHDRSLAPERLWGAFYCDLLAELRQRGAWFPTAGRAIEWFQRRRSATFEAVRCDGEFLRANVSDTSVQHLPGLNLRIHTPTSEGRSRSVDMPVNGPLEANVKIGATRPAILAGL